MATIDYSVISKEVHTAYFAYKATITNPNEKVSLISFAAGYNACLAAKNVKAAERQE